MYDLFERPWKLILVLEAQKIALKWPPKWPQTAKSLLNRTPAVTVTPITVTISYSGRFWSQKEHSHTQKYLTLWQSATLTFMPIPTRVTVTEVFCSNFHIGWWNSLQCPDLTISLPECAPWRTCSSPRAAQRRQRRRWPTRTDWNWYSGKRLQWLPLKSEFLKNRGSWYHKMVLGHHKGISELPPAKIWRFSSH